MIINGTGTNGASGIDTISLANLLETDEADVSKLWAHAVGLYLFTLYAFRLMRENYRHYRNLRQQFFLDSDMETQGGDVRLVGDKKAHRSMLVFHVPKDFRTDEKVHSLS